MDPIGRDRIINSKEASLDIDRLGPWYTVSSRPEDYCTLRFAVVVRLRSPRVDDLLRDRRSKWQFNLALCTPFYQIGTARVANRWRRPTSRP